MGGGSDNGGPDNGRIGVGGMLKFQANDEQGALLFLKSGGHRREIMLSRRLKAYMLRHYRSWYTFAAENVDLDLPADGLILVSGWVKTDGWMLAAFTSRGSEMQMSVNLAAEPWVSVQVGYAMARSTTSAPQYRISPRMMPDFAHDMLVALEDENHSDDSAPLGGHCVFLHYHKIKTKGILGPRIMKAAADPYDLGRYYDDDDDGEIFVPAGLDGNMVDCDATEEADAVSASHILCKYIG